MRHPQMREYREKITLDHGALWEDGVNLCLDYLLLKDHGTPLDDPPCPHCKYIETFHFAGYVHDQAWSENAYICPRVVVSYNEGGHATTGVCLDCLIEATKGE